MVEVVQQTASESVNNSNGILQNILHNLPIIIFVALIIGLCVIVYIMWKNGQEKDKSRDHPVYEAYCNTVDSCLLNANHKWIDCKWSKLNLFWFGIPLIKIEHSAKIRNKDDEVLGWYRGHYYDQLGYLNILYYKTKKFFIIENTNVLKCPISPSVRVKKLNKDNEIIFEIDGKTPKTELKKFDFKPFIKFLPNNDIKINALSFETYSYFQYPIYSDQMDKAVNLSQVIDENVLELGHGVLLTHVFEQGATQSRKGMEINPNSNFMRQSGQSEQTKENPAQ